MALWRSNYDWSIGSQYLWLEEKLRPVETKMFYEEAVIRGRGEQLKAIKNTSSKYNADLKAYNEYLAEKERISGEVWGAINDARNWIAKLNCARETHANYLRLADGNQAVARKFFEDTFKANPHLIRELFPDYVAPDEETADAANQD
jgi:hypothetical protein